MRTHSSYPHNRPISLRVRTRHRNTCDTRSTIRGQFLPRTFAPSPAPSHPRTSIIQISMRVAIDARKLHDFGIGTYIRNLLRQLARIDQTSEYVLLTAAAD